MFFSSVFGVAFSRIGDIVPDEGFCEIRREERGMEEGKSYPVLVRAVNHSMVLLAAILGSAALWMGARYPDSSILIVSTAMLSAGAAYDIRTLNGRAKIIFSVSAGTAVFQFVVAMVRPYRILLPIVCFFLTWLTARLVKNRRTAGIIAAVGQLSLVLQGGCEAAADRLIEIGLSGLASLAAVLPVSLVHAPGVWKPEDDGGFYPAESLRLAGIVALGDFLFLALRIPEGVWIPATAAYLYMSKQPGEDLTGKAGVRIWGTVLGMYAGFLFLGCLSYFEYRMIYLLPFIAGFGFFLLYATGNYMIFSLCFMMSFCLGSDLMSSQLTNIHLLQLSVSRILATTIGCGLTILFERGFPGERKKHGMHHAG